MDTKRVFLAQYPQSTRRVYSGVLIEFEGVTGTPIEESGRDSIFKYQEYIKEQSAATIHRKMATLSSYFSYMQKLEIRSDNPALLIRRPKLDPVRSIKWLTRSEVRDLLHTAAETPRTLALVWVGLHGLRVSEIVRLRVEHWRDHALKVTGKGEHTRYVALATPAQQALRAYLLDRTNGPMFALKARRIEEIIGEVSERAGKRINPHALRHTVGTNAIKSGIPTLVVQKFFGHQSPKTTEKYVHLDTSDTQELVDNTFSYLLEEPFSVIEGEGKAV